MTEGDKIIRKFENEILDQQYKKYNFSNYSDEIAIPYLLKYVGDFRRQAYDLTVFGWTDHEIQLLANNLLHGVSHCIRWSQSSDRNFSESVENHEEADIKAAEYMEWGLTYNKLVQDFTAWSRGLKQAKLEHETKRIYFSDHIDIDYGSFVMNQRLYSLQLDIAYAKFPHHLFETTFEKWYTSLKDITPPIASHIDWTLALNSTAFNEFRQVLKSLVFPELNEDFDLGGYQLGHFLTFHASFAINFHFICWIEQKTDEQFGENFNPFGSNPLDFSLPNFYVFARKVTGLEETVIENIVTDLIFDYTHPASVLIFQPLVLSKKGTLFVMPNIYPYIETQRMLSGAFNKGKKREIYARLVKQLEETWLNKIESLIREKTNWKCFKDRIFKYKDRIIRPDFVMIDESSKYILVIDYKHFLPPVNPSEVAYRYSELMKGAEQIDRYLQLLPNIQLQTEEADLNKYKFSGMVLTPLPLVVPLPKNHPTYLFDYTSLNAYFESSSERLSIKSLIDTINKGRVLLNLTLDNYASETIVVGDWEIVRQVIALSNFRF
jgi:hypothetical protein